MATVRPPMVIWPLSSRSMPAIARKSVVLPDPEGPKSTQKLPGSTTRLTPSRAVLPAYVLVASQISTATPRLGSAISHLRCS